ncbi:MAG TPA: hypothetical protein V6D29_16125 [Leptolyngbyaceae cyanobacterium]
MTARIARLARIGGEWIACDRIHPTVGNPQEFTSGNQLAISSES